MFFNIKYPILQAPMAGGASTVDLALAISRKGGLGFLAAGYKTPEAIEKELAVCAASGFPYGVNLFVPQNDPIDTEAIERYQKQLEQDFQMQLEVKPANDDFWQEKLALVRKYQVPFVSFTFGCPSKEVIAQIKENGCVAIVSVTNLEEALIAVNHGADAICLQGVSAGGHRASFQNRDEAPPLSLTELIRLVRKKVEIPIIAAGGIMTGEDIQPALRAGADAVQLGTAFLCTEESGANAVYKEALRSNQFTETALTRAFTGRLARGLKNDFMHNYKELAPAIYPAVHTLTQPIRAKALKDYNPQAMSLWANTRFQEIRSGSADEVFDQLLSEWLGPIQEN